MPDAMPDQLLNSVPVLMGVAVLLGVFLAFLWRMAGLYTRESERRDAAVERLVDRHESAEEKQFQTIDRLAGSVERKATAVADLSSAIGRLSETLTGGNPYFVHNHRPKQPMQDFTTVPAAGPIHRIPEHEWNPDVVVGAKDLHHFLSGDTRDWSHGPTGIKELYDAGVRGAGAVVAVLDTGIDMTHPDLAANGDRVGSRDFTGSPNGWVDSHAHGSHVAGIVASDDQGSGIVGVAPDAAVTAVKVLSNAGSGASSWIAAGIRFAADGPAHILNMSLGSPDRSPDIEAAVNYAVSKGKWLVAAAGNDGPNTVGYPGALPNVLCVAATAPNGQRADFSSTNAEVDVAFPGVNIFSAVPGNRYARMSGTSMATPGVAGVLALAVGELRKRSLKVPTQAEMMKAIKETATDIAPAGPDQGTGYGLVNAKAFLAEILRVATGAVPVPAEEFRVKVPAGTKRVVIDVG